MITREQRILRAGIYRYNKYLTTKLWKRYYEKDLFYNELQNYQLIIRTQAKRSIQEPEGKHGAENMITQF